MNTNWSKILLFSLISFALGFLICCMTCGRCGGGMGMCGKGGGCEEKGECKMHGDKGHCDMDEHAKGGKCCMMGGDSTHMEMHSADTAATGK